MRTYSELIQIPDYYDRFDYLKLYGKVGDETFGYDRWINQQLYQKNSKWKSFRRAMILRDSLNGDHVCDMAHEDFPIIGKRHDDIVILHHINPLTKDDIRFTRDCVFDPENVVCVRFLTHQAIHYGDKSLLPQPIVERQPYDQCPWRRA